MAKGWNIQWGVSHPEITLQHLDTTAGAEVLNDRPVEEGGQIKCNILGLKAEV